MYIAPTDRFGSKIFVEPASVAAIIERIEFLKVTDNGKSRGHGVGIWHLTLSDEDGVLFGRFGQSPYSEIRTLTVTLDEDGSRPASHNSACPWEEMTRQGGYLTRAFGGDFNCIPKLKVSSDDQVRIYDAVYARVRRFIEDGK